MSWNKICERRLRGWTSGSVSTLKRSCGPAVLRLSDLKLRPVVSRESAHTKGRRLLTEGRLRVLHVTSSGVVAAECRGDSGEIYSLGFVPWRKRWHCTCPARGVCAHLVALQLVTTAPVAESAVA